jgi:hypothetical protein
MTNLEKAIALLDELIESDPDRAERFIESHLARIDLLKRKAVRSVQAQSAVGTVITFRGTRSGTGVMRGHTLIAFDVDGGEEQTVSISGGRLTIVFPTTINAVPSDVESAERDYVQATIERLR